MATIPLQFGDSTLQCLDQDVYTQVSGPRKCQKQPLSYSTFGLKLHFCNKLYFSHQKRKLSFERTPFKGEDYLRLCPREYSWSIVQPRSKIVLGKKCDFSICRCLPPHIWLHVCWCSLCQVLQAGETNLLHASLSMSKSL